MKLFNKQKPTQEYEEPPREYLQFDDEEFEDPEEDDLFVAEERTSDTSEDDIEKIKEQKRVSRAKLGMFIWIPLLLISVFVLYQSLSDFFGDNDLNTASPVQTDSVNPDLAPPQDRIGGLVDMLEEDPLSPASGKEEAARPATNLAATMILSTVNDNNTAMIEETIGTIDYAKRYMERQANRSGLRSHLNRSLSDKKAIQDSFETKAAIFATDELKFVMEATRSRNSASIEFTENLIKEVDAGNRNLAPLIDQHREEDNFLKELQFGRVIAYLDAEKIPYSLDDESGTILLGE